MPPRRQRPRAPRLAVLAGGGLAALGLAAPALAQLPVSGTSVPDTTTVPSGNPVLPAPPPSTTAPSTPSTATTPSSPPPSAPPPASQPSGTTTPAPTPAAVSQHAQGPSTTSAASRRPSTPAPAKAKATPKAGTRTAPKLPRVLLGPANVALPPSLAAARFGVVTNPLSTKALSAAALRYFRVPLFLLPILQAAGIEYGVPWQVLGAINEVETDYGRDLSVSSAGAEGWMQFLPETWLQYGVDAIDNGSADPYNPADAIFAAARYLRAAGAQHDLKGAIFAYNHSDAYVQSVLLRAELIASYPEPVIASLTGLTQGRPPATGAAVTGNDSRGVVLQAPRTSPVVAVQDGRVVSLGRDPRLGNYIRLRDVYGDLYTYAGLGRLATTYSAPAPPPRAAQRAALAAREPRSAPRPTVAASAGQQPSTLTPAPAPAPAAASAPSSRHAEVGSSRLRLYAHPDRPAVRAALSAAAAGAAGARTLPLQPGSILTAGTVLGSLGGQPAAAAGQMRFSVQPAGDRRAVDPRPVLTSWKLLQSTLDPRATGQPDGLVGATAGEVFLESRGALEQQVLSDPSISIYSCGREDIAAGAVGRRVLAVLEYLSRVGLGATVSGLRCGQPRRTAAGTPSAHATGDAVDISAINGVSIAGHQGAGSVTDKAIRALLALQGPYVPERIVSLMSYPGATNTVASRRNAATIAIAFAPSVPTLAGRAASLPPSIPAAGISPSQWDTLIARIAAIPNPTVSVVPSPGAVPDPRRLSSALLRRR